MKYIFVGLLLVSLTAWGADKNGAFQSQGQRSCGTFIEARNSRSDQGGYAGAWIGGYITAYNAITPNTYSILGASDYNSVILWMENWCKANPLSSVTSGMEELTIALYPRRYKTQAESGR